MIGLLEQFAGGDSQKLLDLSRAYDSEPARVLIAAVRKGYNIVEMDLVKSPRIDDNVKNDLRYKLGMLAAFEIIADLPFLAGEYLKTMDNEG